jgi:hypothetical protein
VSFGVPPPGGVVAGESAGESGRAERDLLAMKAERYSRLYGRDDEGDGDAQRPVGLIRRAMLRARALLTRRS